MQAYDPSSVRVLLVASDPQTIKAAGSLLKNDGFDIYLAHTLAQAAARCMEEPLDLVILSAEPGEADPFALCRDMGNRTGEGRRTPPFIFLVDGTDPQAMGRAFRSGAADCVSMPCQPEEFLARVRRELELQHAKRSVADQRRELDDAWRRIESFAHLDPSTGLPDRDYAIRRAEEELSRTSRSSQASSIVIAAIPDPPEGKGGRDHLMRAVASLYRAVLRDHDVLCRWTEEAFILILPDCGRKGANALLERFSRVLGQLEPSPGHPRWRCSPDCRILVLDPAEGELERQRAELRALLETEDSPRG